MDPGTRRSVAYVAARIVTKKTSGSVYDYSAGGHTAMSATITPSDVRASTTAVARTSRGASKAADTACMTTGKALT
jgi:hypothetical protein